MEYFPDRVQSFIEEERLFTREDRIVVALSGGADSVCLAETLIWNGYNVGAVHVNHHLRETADRDEAFVRAYCREKGIPCVVKHVDVALRREKTRETLEEAARNLRKEALEQGANELFPGGSFIATAHHKNDQAETVLFHLIRGTGLRGAGGIAVKSGRFVRPLLCVTREEIEAWLAEQDADFCHDETNDLDDATRNMIRHHVLPLLNEIRPGATEKLAREAFIFHDADQYLTKEARKKLKTIAAMRSDGDAISIPADVLQSEEPSMQWYLVYEALSSLGVDMKDKGQRHLADICALAEKPVGKKTLIPGGGIALRTYDCVEIRRVRKPDAPAEDALGYEFETKRIDRTELKKTEESSYTKTFDCDKINKNMLVLRSRQPGDRISTSRGAHKKLKDFMIDEKIPADQRDSVLLLAMGSEILWVVGHRISEEYKADENTENVLEITIRKRSV